MNQELAKIIKIYSIGTKEELISFLKGKSKFGLILMLTELINMYINDKNSSTIREFITVSLAGYIHKERKIGYNGFRENNYSSNIIIKCEAKPKNISSEDFEKYKKGERKTKPAKLNGGGNFTDYSPLRLNKDKKEKRLNILVSGFVDGRLIYIIEFPFNSPRFVKKLENKIKIWRSKLKGRKSIKGQFLRSAEFNYKDYINAPKLKIIFLLKKTESERYKPFISKSFYKFLWNKAK